MEWVGLAADGGIRAAHYPARQHLRWLRRLSADLITFRITTASEIVIRPCCGTDRVCVCFGKSEKKKEKKTDLSLHNNVKRKADVLVERGFLCVCVCVCVCLLPMVLLASVTTLLSLKSGREAAPSLVTCLVSVRGGVMVISIQMSSTKDTIFFNHLLFL